MEDTYELEKADVVKTTSKSWLKAGEIFPETTRFMVAIQDQVISD
jgi:hypothetical protein